MALRNLERKLATIQRKVARKVASGEVEESTAVDVKDLEVYLGLPTFDDT